MNEKNNKIFNGVKDTFGYALFSYWKGDRKTPHIIKRDDGRINKKCCQAFLKKIKG